MTKSIDPTMKIARQIIRRLVPLGVHVLRQNSITTSSVYLKFDFGVLHSCRIGDHKGKEKYSYRYNIGPGISERFTDTTGPYPRCYYSVNDIEELIFDVLAERSQKLARYGNSKYYEFMAIEAQKRGTGHGFWKKAKEVQ